MDNLDCFGPIVDQTLAALMLDYINYWLGGDWISLKGHYPNLTEKFINRSTGPEGSFVLLIWVAEAVLYYQNGQKVPKSTKIRSRYRCQWLHIKIR